MNPAIRPDMTVPCGDGIINIRVGAIILKDNRFLMVKNSLCEYYYSVGGRIKFGETAEEAVIREVYEETGCRMTVDRLGFIQENYYTGDVPGVMGKTIYEVNYYFYMDVPEDFMPVCRSVTNFGFEESLEWLSADTDKLLFPGFFKEELLCPSDSVKFFSCSEI